MDNSKHEMIGLEILVDAIYQAIQVYENLQSFLLELRRCPFIMMQIVINSDQSLYLARSNLICEH